MLLHFSIWLIFSDLVAEEWENYSLHKSQPRLIKKMCLWWHLCMHITLLLACFATVSKWNDQWVVQNVQIYLPHKLSHALKINNSMNKRKKMHLLSQPCHFSLLVFIVFHVSQDSHLQVHLNKLECLGKWWLRPWTRLHGCAGSSCLANPPIQTVFYLSVIFDYSGPDINQA